MYDHTFMPGSADSLRIARSKYWRAPSLSPFLLAIKASPYIADPLFRSKSERIFSNAACALAVFPALNAASPSFNKSRVGFGGGTGGGSGTSACATVLAGIGILLKVS